MDITNLILKLQTKITDNTYNQLAVTKSIDLLKTGQVNYVDSTSELPAASASTGKMYYVRGLGIYYSNSTSWTTIETIIPQGFILAWGNNSLGNVGDNTNTNRASPVSVVGDFTDWCHVSGGGYVTSAVRTNGTAWAWGYGGYGKLGDNTTVNKSSPVSVVGGFTNWSKLSTGKDHLLGLQSNGTLWAWGYGGYGRLGNNCTTHRSSPVSVVGGFTDWCYISAGRSSFGIRTNGVLYAWGQNGGRLGDGTAVNRSSPVSVVGGFTDWCAVHNRNPHTVAVRTNGTAWAWGCNGQGRLGDNSITNRSSPVSVVGGFTDWCQVATAYNASIGLRTGGTIYSWGSNGRGLLGINTCGGSCVSPVVISGGVTNWCQITSTYNSFSALKTDGTIWSWGYNTSGQLGDNTSSSRSSPVSVVGGITNWCYLGSGGEGVVPAIRYNLDS